MIKEIRDVDRGEIITTEKKTLRRVLSQKNAQLLKMMLSSVVVYGSGYTACIAGYPLCFT